MATLPDQGELRARAEAVASDWGLVLGEPYGLSRYSFVAPVDDRRVLKVGWAGDDESLHEADSLLLWDGDGAVKLLRHDRGRRALLEERAVPGTDLSQVPEAEALAVAVEVGVRLWRPAGAPFRRVADELPRWLGRAERGGGAGTELLPLARRLLSRLELGHERLVHGDFHHHNLLRHGERHVAIDSKAMLGDPEYDVPSFLWNPLDHRLVDRDETEARIAAFVAAGLDDAKIRAWTVIRAAYLGADPDESELIRALLKA